jgi:hypothetical protein
MKCELCNKKIFSVNGMSLPGDARRIRVAPNGCWFSFEDIRKCAIKVREDSEEYNTLRPGVNALLVAIKKESAKRIEQAKDADIEWRPKMESGWRQLKMNSVIKAGDQFWCFNHWLETGNVGDVVSDLIYRRRVKSAGRKGAK